MDGRFFFFFFFFEGGIPTLGSGVFECRTLFMATYECATYAVCRKKKIEKRGRGKGMRRRRVVDVNYTQPVKGEQNF